MGKKKKKKKLIEQKKQAKKTLIREEILSFNKKNYSLFSAGIISIIVGYLFLSRGSITIAPILLVLGYVILIPISIIIK
ncbi:hypothetical protein KAU34_06580 [candidate division WOR-3 bacterium]|nr:hypothetical protein [candidate division WOR-3 bacterium]MCK4576054.1 hypothetical protein [candidate division WOR-3 bacterium]